MRTRACMTEDSRDPTEDGVPASPTTGPKVGRAPAPWLEMGPAPWLEQLGDLARSEDRITGLIDRLGLEREPFEAALIEALQRSWPSTPVSRSFWRGTGRMCRSPGKRSTTP